MTTDENMPDCVQAIKTELLIVSCYCLHFTSYKILLFYMVCVSNGSKGKKVGEEVGAQSSCTRHFYSSKVQSANSNVFFLLSRMRIASNTIYVCNNLTDYNDDDDSDDVCMCIYPYGHVRIMTFYQKELHFSVRSFDLYAT